MLSQKFYNFFESFAIVQLPTNHLQSVCLLLATHFLHWQATCKEFLATYKGFCLDSKQLAKSFKVGGS